LPIDEALAQERAVFQTLRLSREAHALRHQFFAERESAKQPALVGVAPRRVQRLAGIGAGTQRASDVDVVLVNGYGFPRWEGAPVFWAREGGAEALESNLAWLARLSGPGFARGDVRHLLQPGR
jgi:3-hydroxyacyl-CoA dehydrogenase